MILESTQIIMEESEKFSKTPAQESIRLNITGYLFLKPQEDNLHMTSTATEDRGENKSRGWGASSFHFETFYKSFWEL